MSVAEFPAGGSARAARGSGGDAALDPRMPPQDVAAEQSVLGGMLLSKDAIADVVEVLRGADFYRPAHELVYDVVLDLYGRGEPADPVTVAAELTKRGELNRVGGAPYLHTLISTVPTAANAGYYAQIVRDRAVLRRLVEAGTRIVQMGYAESGEVDDVVDRAQAEVYGVTDRRTTEDYVPLSAVMEGALDEIEAIGSRGGEMVGVPTGIGDLDSLTNGLHGGQMVVLAARPAIGKALALDTPLPTPAGWTTMGEVEVGDYLLGADGKPTRVVAATEVMHGRPCYEVEFSDGTVVVADESHQWLTETRASRRSARAAAVQYKRHRNQRTFAAVRTTQEIAGTLRCDTAERRLNHSVRNAKPLDPSEQDLPLDAYALGIWLGDGHADGARFTSADPEIAMYLEAAGLRVQAHSNLLYGLRLPQPPPTSPRTCVVCGAPFLPQTVQVRTCGRSCGGKARSVSTPVPPPSCRDCGGPMVGLSSGTGLCQRCWSDHGTVPAILRSLGVFGNKHIPQQYLRASQLQRRALLAGLLDTDGTVAPGGNVQFTSTNQRLAEGVHELVVSLGYRCMVTTRRVKGRTAATSTAYTLNFSTEDEVFRLERKKLLHKQRGTRLFQRRDSRFITAVRLVKSVPVRCVQVDNVEHLYLASRSMIPTHNSTLALDFARAAAVKHQLSTCLFSLEMGRNEITMRLLSAEARVPLHHMRTGTMTDDDWNRLARRMGEVSSAPLFIDDSPNLTMMEIRAKCRRLKQRHDLRLVIIDYLQLLTSGKRVENRQQEVSEFSRSLKLLAKELDVPVVALSQLNRGPEQRTDKRPLLSDLRESGCMTADTTLLRADTGAPVTFGQLLRDGCDGVLVWSLDEQRRLVPAPLTNVYASGVKETYRLRLASGREVKASGNHPFLAVAGWRRLDELAVGSRIAAPRVVPEPIGAGLGWSEHRLGLLAHLLGEACVPADQAMHYNGGDEADLGVVDEAAPAKTLHEWFDRLGIGDLGSHEKRIPDELHRASNAEVAVFLRHLWATDGCVDTSSNSGSGTPTAHYAACSRALADGVALLLARFGIIADIRQVAQGRHHPSYQVVVEEGSSLGTFRRRIGVPSGLGARAEQLSREDEHSTDNPDADSLPLPSDDVFWDRVVAIEPLGALPVFDATVKGTHNFIADGIVAHNSIEQDSDVVILLHREDMYEKESPRAGEADLIVAKHRNGPTATVTVAFQGHYSRFVDMAQS